MRESRLNKNFSQLKVKYSNYNFTNIKQLGNVIYVKMELGKDNVNSDFNLVRITPAGAFLQGTKIV